MDLTRTTYDPDLPYRFRQTVGPWITRLAKRLGQPEYRLRRSEYVGTVQCPVGELVSELESGGFSWGPISLFHQPPVGRSPDGSWTYRSSVLADRQLHVILWAGDGDWIDVYAHDEPNWIRHPLEHLRQDDICRSQGAAEMRSWLQQRGLEYDRASRLRRRATELIAKGRKRVAEWLHQR